MATTAAHEARTEEPVGVTDEALASAFVSLRDRFADLRAVRLDPGVVAHCPRIHVTFARAAWADRLGVLLLCEDRVHCKVVLIWQGQPASDHAPRQIGPFLTLLTKARVHGVAFAREIVLPDEPLSGFVSLADAGGEAAQPWRRLVQVLARHIAAGDRFQATLADAA